MPRTAKSYLPRLPREYYRGDAVVHWTMTVEGRAKGWLNPAVHQKFRELMFHVASREGLLCPNCSSMPGHIHLFWIELYFDTDQIKGITFLRTYLEPLLAPATFQHQAHDHVLKESERKKNAFAKTCFYITNNPVKDGLVERVEDWPYNGTVVPGCPELNQLADDYWGKFWRIPAKLKHADAASQTLPPME